VHIEAAENNWATLTSGNATFKFTGLAAEEFPALPDVEAEGFMELDRALMRELVKRTIFAAGDNDTRYVLNGIFVGLTPSGGGLEMEVVGTDGHRLALARKFVESAGRQAEASAIVPKKSAAELRKLLEEDDGPFEMALTRNHVVFKLGALYMVSRLIEGSYPNYNQVIPADNDKSAEADRASLVSALRRVSLLSRERTNAVKFAFAKGAVTLSSQNPEMGEASEGLPVGYDGPGLEVGFNAKYLLDALSVMDKETVSLSFKDQLSPCIITQAEDPDYRCVVMPLRV
jgi:DNA polymerase-3 subunit beta